MDVGPMDPQALKKAADILALIGSLPRIRMIRIMLDREISVSQLAIEIEMTQSATSQHLAKMMSFGLITQRKSHQNRFCCISGGRKAMIRRVLEIAEEFEHNG